MGYASGDETHHDLPAVVRRAGSYLYASNYIGWTEPCQPSAARCRTALFEQCQKRTGRKS